MVKVQVQLAASSHPQQVDVPEGAERSVKGALHFHPGSAKQITADELAHIQAHEPALAKKLRVIAEEAAESEAKPKATASAPPAGVSTPSTEEEKPKPPKDRRSKRERDKNRD